MAKMVGAHKASVHKGKRRCKKCGKRHSVSVHWSHEHGPHKGAHGETAWYGRKPRPQGKRKIRKPARKKAKARRHPHAAYTRGGTHFGAITTHRPKHLKRMTAAEMRRLGRAATRKAKKAHKGGRKKARSPAQKAATARMLAALAAKRAHGVGHAIHHGRKGRRGLGRVAGIPMHHVRGHLAKNPHKKGKHRVKAHMAAEPGFAHDIRPAHRTRLG